MITDRLLTEADVPFLEASLAADVHHFSTPVDFFKQLGTISKVYEDEQGPIFYARATSSFRLDIHFVDNNDRKRNATALAAGIGPLVEQARANGFTEILFTTNVMELAAYCQKVFGYELVPDEYVLRKLL